MTGLKSLVESARFQRFVIVVIIINAITLGLETSPAANAAAGGLLSALDRIALTIFVVEIALKLLVYRHNFFRDGWNIFDFLVVAVTLAPVGEGVSVLRALRILRVLRLVSVVPSLRRVVSGLASALPGMGSIVLLLGLVYYVFAVMATKLFAATFPEKFGSLGQSAYTLFEVMTMDSWSTGTVRPMLEVHPWAWTFFLPFVVVTTFAVLNLFIGIIVSAMQEEHDAAGSQARTDEQEAILAEIRALRAEVRALKARAD